MKKFLCSVCLSLISLTSPLYAGGSLACGGTLEVTIHGKSAKTEYFQLTNALQALLESCSVDSSEYAASEKKWKSLLTSRAFLHFTISNGAQFNLKTKGEIPIEIEEIILPLPSGSYPDHLYVKNKQGFYAYAKYDPRILRKIIAAPEVNLASEPPYNSLPDETQGHGP